MIAYDQAIETLLAQITRQPAESCALPDVVGRVLASSIASPIALPTFDHAAMDGYALCAQQPLPAGSDYDVVGSQAAGETTHVASGDMQDPESHPKGACEIMTGARLPEGFNAVVAIERTDRLSSDSAGMPLRIRLLEPLATGENVRYAGSDVAIGAQALAAGTRLEPAHIMLLAALGVSMVDVVRRPRVAIICTGRELQADPTQPLAAERIHNSNGPYLVAALTVAGAQVSSCETVDDTGITFADALQRALDAGADFLVSTGAVSMGRHDFVPETLRRFNAELLFHKVAMRPGKPVLCARLVEGPLIIALPGTPMAVAAGLRFIVSPVLRAMLGQGREQKLQAILDAPQQPKIGLRHFLRATLYQGLDGYLHAIVCQQQPFRIRPFTEADVWIVLPEDAGECVAGTRVEVVSLEPGSMPRISADP